MIDAYDRGEKHRQEILDLLHLHGPMTMTVIAGLLATKTSIATVHKRVRSMFDLGEVTHTNTPRHVYSAIAEKTTAAEVFRNRHRDALVAYNEARRKRMVDPVLHNNIKISGPRITHICSDHLPTPSGYGGGQGRHRPARGFASTEL